MNEDVSPGPPAGSTFGGGGGGGGNEKPELILRHLFGVTTQTPVKHVLNLADGFGYDPNRQARTNECKRASGRPCSDYETLEHRTNRSIWQLHVLVVVMLNMVLHWDHKFLLSESSCLSSG